MTISTPSIWHILTIDDNVSIHQDYKKVLLEKTPDTSLADVESALFGDAPPKATQPTHFRYEIDSALQGEEGFNLVKKSIDQGREYSVALVDVRMPPGWDGIETVKRIWEIYPELPIVLCTAYSDYGWEQITAELPLTDQLLILKKPFEPLELRQIVAFAALAKLAEFRDPETGEHLNRIEQYTRILLERLAVSGPYVDRITPSYIDYVSRSSILHDIGKVGIPDKILLKPGRLTAEEYAVMKTHAEIGADALNEAKKASHDSDFLSMAEEIARSHHEKFDGSGYPAELVGRRIPLSARVVAVADVYDALTTARKYKEAMCPLEARQIIESERGKHFDPAVVDAFIDCWDCFYEAALRVQVDYANDRGTSSGDTVREVYESTTKVSCWSAFRGVEQPLPKQLQSRLQPLNWARHKIGLMHLIDKPLWVASQSYQPFASPGVLGQSGRWL